MLFGICFYLVKLDLFSKPLKYRPFPTSFSVAFCRNYSEGAIVWWIARLLRLFNGWSTLVEPVTMLFIPVMGGKFNWLGSVDGYCAQTNEVLKTSGTFGMGVWILD